MSSKSNSKSAGSATAGPGSGSPPVNLKSGVWDHFFARQCKADRAVQVMLGKCKNGRRVNKSFHTHLPRERYNNILKGSASKLSKPNEHLTQHNSTTTQH
jgi:hypothetical protein